MSADPASAKRRALQEVARAMRGALGSLRAATETLGAYPDLDSERRARLLAVIAEEAARLDTQVRRMERLAAGASEPAERRSAEVPELLEGLRRVADEAGLACEVERPGGEELDDVHIVADVDALLRASRGFFGDLRRAMAVTRCTVRASVVDRHLLVDLGWRPDPGDLPRVFEWQGAALGTDAGPGGDGGLREVARDHDGEAWFNLDRDGTAAHVRILLPIAATAPVPA